MPPSTGRAPTPRCAAGSSGMTELRSTGASRARTAVNGGARGEGASEEATLLNNTMSRASPRRRHTGSPCTRTRACGSSASMARRTPAPGACALPRETDRGGDLQVHLDEPAAGRCARCAGRAAAHVGGKGSHDRLDPAQLGLRQAAVREVAQGVGGKSEAGPEDDGENQERHDRVGGRLPRPGTRSSARRAPAFDLQIRSVVDAVGAQRLAFEARRGAAKMPADEPAAEHRGGQDGDAQADRPRRLRRAQTAQAGDDEPTAAPSRRSPGRAPPGSRSARAHRRGPRREARRCGAPRSSWRRR